MNYQIMSKKFIIKHIIQHHYDKIVSFATYPIVEKNLPQKLSGQYIAKLSHEDLNSERFINNIQPNNHIAFVGLNQAKRNQNLNPKQEPFQLMHNIDKKSHDYQIAKTINYNRYRNEIRGSLMFDLIQNIKKTKLENLSDIINKIKQQPIQSYKPETQLYNLHNLKNDPTKKTNQLSSNALVNTITKHIQNYDIKIIKSLIHQFDLRTIFCFGKNAYDLLQCLKQQYSLPIKVIHLYHFAGRQKNENYITDIETNIENSKKTSNNASDAEIMHKLLPNAPSTMLEKTVTKHNLLQILTSAQHDKDLIVNSKDYQLLNLIRVIYQRANNEQLSVTNMNNIKNLISNLKNYFHGKEQEHLIAIAIDRNSQILDSKICNIGSNNASLMDIQSICKFAIQSNAQAMIIAHNHPQGHSTPSTNDINMTKQIQQALNILQIQLINSLVFSDNEHQTIL